MSNTPLHIGFDAKRIVRNGTGLGAYGRTLVNDLAQYPLQLSLYAPDKGRDDLRTQIIQRPNVAFKYANKPWPFGKAYWRSRGIVNDLQRDGVQLYHGLSGELPSGIRNSGIPSVVTIHDLIFLRHPEFYNPIDVKLYTWKFRRTLREATHIIAISECTRRDILHYAPDVDPEKISVIYQSCAPKFNGSAVTGSVEGLPPDLRSCRYILNVGTIEARKNVLLAVKALEEDALPGDLHLVIVGRHTSYTDEVSRYVRAHGLDSRVHILHGVSDAELPALYAGAEAFVYPSRYEGFGIPIIEAISCGLPVVACSGSCLEEAGGPDTLYVDPDDPRAMATAIRQVLKGAPGRDNRIVRSRTYIRRFEGNDVAGQVYRLYERLIK